MNCVTLSQCNTVTVTVSQCDIMFYIEVVKVSDVWIFLTACSSAQLGVDV